MKCPTLFMASPLLIFLSGARISRAIFSTGVSVSAMGHTIGIEIDYARYKTADASSATEASETPVLLLTCPPADWSAETLDPSLVTH